MYSTSLLSWKPLPYINIFIFVNIIIKSFHMSTDIVAKASLVLQPGTRELKFSGAHEK